MLRNWLGRSGPSKKDAEKDSRTAHEQSSELKEMLEKKIKFTEGKVKSELKRAMEFKKQKNNKAALLCMKRKVIFEKQVEQYNNQLLRIEEQLVQFEESKTAAQVFASMKGINEATKANMQSTNIEEVDRVLDQVQETQDEMRMINDALSNPIGEAGGIDDEDLLEQLDEMEAENLDEQLLSTKGARTSEEEMDMGEDEFLGLPKPPAANDPIQNEEKELEDLAAEYGL